MPLTAMNGKDSIKVLVKEIERKNKTEQYSSSIKNSKSKLIDFLTPELCTRLAKCIDLESINAFQTNTNINMELVPGHTLEDGHKNARQLNFECRQHTFTEDDRKIDDTKTSVPQFKMHFDLATNLRKSADLKRTWMSNYLRKPRNDRVKWESKFYKYERSYAGKSLSEKTEEMMDLSKYLFDCSFPNKLTAGDFADWLKSLGSDGKVNMDKDLIKKLFSIGIEDDAAKSLHVAPIFKSAIPENIANIVRLPDLAIEKNVNRIMMEDKKLSKLVPKYVAFGRTLPPPLRLTKFEIQDRINRPDFPDDLRSNKIVFDGITHLRSTKLLKGYLDEHLDIPRPTFLLEMKRKEPKNIQHKHYSPLYEIAKKL